MPPAAVRTVRAHAGEWKLDPAHVGIIGSSAGGHLASTLLTHFDPGKPGAEDIVERQSSRPDLGILCYAVITMGEFTHKGSMYNRWTGPLPRTRPRIIQRTPGHQRNAPLLHLAHLRGQGCAR